MADTIPAGAAGMPAEPAAGTPSRQHKRKQRRAGKEPAGRSHASFNYSGDQVDVLNHEAARHGVTVGILCRDYALRLIQMQMEDALAGQGNGSADKALIHTQIAGLEKRMASTVTRLRDELADNQAQLTVIATLLDVFLTAYLMHTPAVQDDQKAVFAASGRERYERLIARAAQAIQGVNQAPIVSKLLTHSIGE